MDESENTNPPGEEEPRQQAEASTERNEDSAPGAGQDPPEQETLQPTRAEDWRKSAPAERGQHACEDSPPEHVKVTIEGGDKALIGFRGGGLSFKGIPAIAKMGQAQRINLGKLLIQQQHLAESDKLLTKSAMDLITNSPDVQQVRLQRQLLEEQKAQNAVMETQTSILKTMADRSRWEGWKSGAMLLLVLATLVVAAIGLSSQGCGENTATPTPTPVISSPVPSP